MKGSNIEKLISSKNNTIQDVMKQFGKKTLNVLKSVQINREQKVLSSIDSSKFLGLYVDQKLSWEQL